MCARGWLSPFVSYMLGVFIWRVDTAGGGGDGTVFDASAPNSSAVGQLSN